MALNPVAVEAIGLDPGDAGAGAFYCMTCDAGPFQDLRIIEAHLAGKLHQKRAATSGAASARECLVACSPACSDTRSPASLRHDEIEHLPEYVDVNIAKQGKIVCLLCKTEANTFLTAQLHLGSINHARACARLGYPALVYSSERRRLELKETGLPVCRSDDAQHVPVVPEPRVPAESRPRSVHGTGERHPSARPSSPPPQSSRDSACSSPGTDSTAASTAEVEEARPRSSPRAWASTKKMGAAQEKDWDVIWDLNTKKDRKYHSERQERCCEANRGSKSLERRTSHCSIGSRARSANSNPTWGKRSDNWTNGANYGQRLSKEDNRWTRTDKSGTSQEEQDCNVHCRPSPAKSVQCGDVVVARIPIAGPPPGYSAENFLVPVDINEALIVAHVEDDWFWGVTGTRKGWAPLAAVT